MADNSNNRKKTLIIGVLAFLLTGGGIFLFFVIQGSNDLTGANRKNAFTYGGAAREATASFFKFIGFEDVEDIAPKGDKERIRIKEYEAAGLLDGASASASQQDEGIPWAPPAASGRSASPSNIPRMGGRGTSGVGGMGGGGTKSSGGASRFGDASGAGNTKVSNSLQEAGTGVKGKDSLAALAKTRVLLGDGLRSGSAATAKGKWDSSFGVGRSAGGGGNDLAYGKTGLVNLDKIKKGEVDNLKTTDPKSLKVPEVGAPKSAEKDGKNADGSEKKTTAQEALEKSMASSVMGAMGQGLSNAVAKPSEGGTSRSDSEDRSGETGGGDFRSGTCTSPSSEGCSAVTTQWSKKFDQSADFQELAVTGEGTVVKVTYKGEGPAVTPEYKGQTVSYSDTCHYIIGAGDPPTVSVMSCSPPVETPK
jgi:hypothetical protein